MNPSQELTIDRQQIFSFTPTSLKEAMEYAKVIAESELVPKDYRGKPGNVLVAVQMGMEVGLKPLQAIQNIAVINGRPSLWGDALLALIRAHESFESILEEQSDAQAICTVKRKGEPEKTVTFSMEDAKRAGLSGKEGPWRTYPKRMMQMRARAFALRDTWPDVLKGISVAEEVNDYIDAESKDISAMAEKAKKMREELAAVPVAGIEKKLDGIDDVSLAFANADSEDAIRKIWGGLSRDQMAMYEGEKDRAKRRVGTK